MDMKVIVQIFMDIKLREFIKKAATLDDRSLSSYIRVNIQKIAEKRLGENYERYISH